MVRAIQMPPAAAARNNSIAIHGYPKIVRLVGMRISIAAPTISAASTRPSATRGNSVDDVRCVEPGHTQDTSIQQRQVDVVFHEENFLSPGSHHGYALALQLSFRP